MTAETKKVAIVTGASRGIGRAVACEMAACGYYVVVNYKKSEEAAQATLARIRDAGGDGELCPFDVSDAAAASSALGALFARYPSIAALINNAGIIADGLFVLMPPSDWQTVIDTSLKGFYNVTKPVLERMVMDRKGAIVTLSSVSGIIGNRGQSNYAAAKAGLIGATKAIASEVARLGIRVNAVAPGLVETDMIKDVPADMVKKLIPMARVGRAEEVARVVRFLCSDDASYITGQVISVNGGMV
jgi:3-oxoacyl-[acyl-carrier protein] reductase